MNQWLLIRRLRGPAFLLLIGVMALLHEWADFSFARSWPLLLILAGVLSLAERAALSRADVSTYDPIPGQPANASTYGSAGGTIIPPAPAGTDPDKGRS